MPANKVDILFVIDASDSMTPCFQKLQQNLRRFLAPLNQASFAVRFGLLAYNMGVDGRNAIYEHTFLGGSNPQLLRGLYDATPDAAKYFTADTEAFLQALGTVRTQGDENTPLALDIAADFPFAPADESRRVIALFSNEPLEANFLEEQSPQDQKPLAKFPQVLQKIAKRKISLYAYLPASDAAAMMPRLPKSIIKAIDAGPDCWDKVDFGQILEQMGKSISASTLQMTREPAYQPATYGQDRWDTNTFVSAGDERREKIRRQPPTPVDSRQALLAPAGGPRPPCHLPARQQPGACLLQSPPRAKRDPRQGRGCRRIRRSRRKLQGGEHHHRLSRRHLADAPRNQELHRKRSLRRL